VSEQEEVKINKKRSLTRLACTEKEEDEEGAPVSNPWGEKQQRSLTD
jgi:hypothetical protein